MIDIDILPQLATTAYMYVRCVSYTPCLPFVCVESVQNHCCVVTIIQMMTVNAELLGIVPFLFKMALCVICLNSMYKLQSYCRRLLSLSHIWAKVQEIPTVLC